MIDLDIIGRRIKEQRKYFLKVSQEKMAEDLNMYQADISNMEKAKSGSGIGDLQKLDLIANYLNIPLETLIFGREDKNMLKYHGNKMQLAKSKRSMLKTHCDILKRLLGISPDKDLSADMWECGPYVLYGIVEFQQSIKNGEETSVLPKVHLFVFIGTECIGSMVYDVTDLMAHVCQPVLGKLQEMIPTSVLDVVDVWRTLNPYWAIWHLTDDEKEKESVSESMFKRIEDLREKGQNRPILYIESAYVREDCRQNGVFHMMVDYAKATQEGCILWLNMEPTSGSELDSEYGNLPSYSISDLGQLNLNASIAERVGFVVDPDVWHREAETLGSDGKIHIEEIAIRKCAYYLPPEIKEIVAKDGKLVEKGRALQLLNDKGDDTGEMDLCNGKVGDDTVCEIKYSKANGNFFYAIAVAKPDGTYRYLVTKSSLLKRQKERIIEEYTSLRDASQSEKLQELSLANSMLLMHLEPSQLLNNEAFMDRVSELHSLPCGSEDPDEETFDASDIQGFSCRNEDGVYAYGLHAKLTRTNTDKKGEVLYAIVWNWEDGDVNYMLSRTSLEDGAEPDPIVEVDSREELETCHYKNIFLALQDFMDSDEFQEAHENRDSKI